MSFCERQGAGVCTLTEIFLKNQSSQTGIKGSVEHRVLFDTGPHSAIFLDNARRLELEFEKIEVVVLSHWHIDHSGGMLAAVDQIRAAKERAQQPNKVLIDLHPDRPDQRGAALKPAGEDASSPAEYVAWGADPMPEDLEKAGGKVIIKYNLVLSPHLFT